MFGENKDEKDLFKSFSSLFSPSTPWDFIFCHSWTFNYSILHVITCCTLHIYLLILYIGAALMSNIFRWYVDMEKLWYISKFTSAFILPLLTICTVVTFSYGISEDRYKHWLCMLANVVLQDIYCGFLYQ